MEKKLRTATTGRFAVRAKRRSYSFRRLLVDVAANSNDSRRVPGKILRKKGMTTKEIQIDASRCRSIDVDHRVLNRL